MVKRVVDIDETVGSIPTEPTKLIENARTVFNQRPPR